VPEQPPDDGFAEYVKEARPAIRRSAFMLVGDWYEADDLVQRTLIALYRRWNRLDGHDHLGGYVRTVMVRLVISDRRRHRWSREQTQDSLPEPPPEPDATRQIADRQLLIAALAELPPRQRSAIVLRYWEDLSVEETARTMGCSAATVRSQTARAMAILRRILLADSGQGTADRAQPPHSRPESHRPG
jgi:RNA polymerase sigma-70 factor (sigma-E family)